MVCTTVPKAAVHEDGHVLSGEHDVRPPSDAEQRIHLNPIAETTPMERRT